MSLSLFRGGQNDKRFRRLSLRKERKKKCGKNWGLFCVQLVEPPAPSGQPARHAADKKKEKKVEKSRVRDFSPFFWSSAPPARQNIFLNTTRRKTTAKKEGERGWKTTKCRRCHIGRERERERGKEREREKSVSVEEARACVRVRVFVRAFSK